MVYRSSSQALAMLEILVNLTGAERKDLPLCVLIPASFSERLVDEQRTRDLPAGWDAPAGGLAAGAMGDAWLAAER